MRLGGLRRRRYNSGMVQAIKQVVVIQPGGRVEIVSADLPVGREAEVIVLVPVQAAANNRDAWGLFGDEPELVDQIVRDALDARPKIGRGR